MPTPHPHRRSRTRTPSQTQNPSLRGNLLRMMQQNDDRLGRLAYEGYAMNTGWKSLVNADNLPSWDDLGDEYKTAWIASARAVLGNAQAAA